MVLISFPPKQMIGAIILVNLLFPLHPIGRYILYPFSFLATWVHEMGHVLATIIVGGTVREVQLQANLSGKAKSKRPDTIVAGFISPTFGLLGPAVIGSLIISWSASPFLERTIWVTIGGMLVATSVTWVRNTFGFLMCISMGGLFLWASTAAGSYFTFWSLQAIGIRFGAESIGDIRYMFSQYSDSGQPSDTQIMASKVGLTYWFWGIVLGAMSISMFGYSLYSTWAPLFAG